MAIILMVIPFLALTYLGTCRLGVWRRAMLHAAVAWGVLIMLITEGLSLVKGLTYDGAVAAWASVSVLVVAIVLLSRPWRRRREAPVSAPLMGGETVMLVLLGFVVLVVGVTGIVAPPNTWDAMESHMPRAFFWMQNHSIGFFPTAQYNQNLNPPFPEFAILQTMLLLGSDRAANMVEYVSMLGSVLGAAMIARRLGGGRGAQILAALVCATIPEGALEASGAQSTYVVTFWIVTAVYFMLLIDEDSSWLNRLSLACAIALCFATKGIAYIFLPGPLLACWLIGRAHTRWILVRAIPVSALIILAINIGHWSRNYQLTGLPLGVPWPPAGPLGGGYGNASINVGGTAANVLRNISLHLAMPGGGRVLMPLFEGAMRLIGQDPGDPTHTWLEMGFRWPFLSRHEIFQGNPLHMLLGLVGLAIVIVTCRDRRNLPLLLYGGGLVISFVMYCALLRYTIWNSRYQMPVFALSAPFIALVLSRAMGRRAGVIVGCVMFAACLPLILDNKLRSLVPGDEANIFQHSRDDLYFADQHLDIAAPFEAASHSLDQSSCHEIGIYAALHQPESTLVFSPTSFFVYPLLAMLYQADPNRRMSYVGVTNPSSQYSAMTLQHPCTVICIDCTSVPAIQATYGLNHAQNFGYLSVLTNP